MNTELNDIVNVLSVLNFIINSKTISNDDLEKILNKKIIKILETLDSKLDLIIEQNNKIISLEENKR